MNQPHLAEERSLSNSQDNHREKTLFRDYFITLWSSRNGASILPMSDLDKCDEWVELIGLINSFAFWPENTSEETSTCELSRAPGFCVWFRISFRLARQRSQSRTISWRFKKDSKNRCRLPSLLRSSQMYVICFEPIILDLLSFRSFSLSVLLFQIIRLLHFLVTLELSWKLSQKNFQRMRESRSREINSSSTRKNANQPTSTSALFHLHLTRNIE